MVRVSPWITAHVRMNLCDMAPRRRSFCRSPCLCAVFSCGAEGMHHLRSH